MTIEQNDIELISIKAKSLEELDGELPENKNTNHLTSGSSCLKLNANKSEKCAKDSDFSSENDGDNDDDDHYQSSVRFIEIEKSPNGACGFHLTRTKWDPYPWVSAIDDYTPAAKTALKPGDCILEVNGCDVLGLRITEIAKLVKSSQHQVTLLLWSTNCNTNCHEESLCAAPMPRTLQRLSVVVQSVLSLIECPVCRDTITPPAMQCQNGHLLCVNCRIRAEKCPVCRDRYYPRPALIAEQLQTAITSAFNLCRNEDKVRQKIFGRHKQQKQMVKTTLQHLQQQQRGQDTTVPLQQTFEFKQQNNDETVTDSSVKRPTKCHKFLTKLLTTKAYSMENLTNGHNNIATTTTTACNIASSSIKDEQRDNDSLRDTNQLNEFTRTTNRNHHYSSLSTPSNHQHKTNRNGQANSIDNLNLNINSKPCCQQQQHQQQQQMTNNNKMQHFSISSSDVSQTPTCLLFTGKASKRSCTTALGVQVCETPYATIPRAIKFKDKYDVEAEREGHDNVCQYASSNGNFLKSTSSSMTCLNLSSTTTITTTPSNTSTPGYCRCQCSVTDSPKSSSSVTQNCQSSLSSTSSSSSSSSAYNKPHFSHTLP